MEQLSLEKSVNTLAGKLSYNISYAKAATRAGKYDSILEGQHPDITLVTCSDSRVLERALDDEIGKVFSIKNIGNRVEPNLGSIEYGVGHLHTPILMILGHTGCGAIHASTRDVSGEHYRIIRSLEFIKPTVAEVQKLLIKKGGIAVYMADHPPWVKPVSEEAYFETLVTEANVDRQVEAVLNDDKIRELVYTGKLMVVGAIYDFKDIYSPEKGAVFVININGETDVEKLKRLNVLSSDGKVILDKIKRLLVY
ncbi:Carbonic anhydrase [Methanocella conradii HZ254]|uniref:carbonic anhydrase n=1 Tax=Methanocella conradii (strain DSM 24694 / JCM 17849 / CGMCC 1.5162 / HZ254) TaxID=1041930 RepID=H8I843_METCZ|nr:carbonic anhydrase [Methanocella conradii]AFD00861.1 Carbonic anhydrase [Methanocella conradii HZ254]MDI6897542.1 carbonic anhydrase [Methanocella conradii]